MFEKHRLVILSDIFGEGRATPWLNAYISELKRWWVVEFYSICDLGSFSADLVKLPDTLQENERKDMLEQYFLDKHVDRAIDSLMKKEQGEVYVLGFGIGASLAWKASLRGLNVRVMFAISAVGLEKETEKPSCRVNLHYGELDCDVPSGFWFKNIQLGYVNIMLADHFVYRLKNFQEEICFNICLWPHERECWPEELATQKTLEEPPF